MALFDAFLKLDGITGESKVSGHEGEIELDSWSFGVSNATNVGGTGGGAGEGKVVFQDFHFTSKVGKHTPQLFESLVSSKVISKGFLTLDTVNRTGKLAPDLKIMFEKVFLTEHKTMDIVSLKLEDAVSPEGGLITSGPEDSASFSFQKVEISSGGITGTGGGGTT
jgi:type VI protein secretion system component Hcp